MTSRQNDTNREPLSIAEEILNDLKATEPSPAKTAETAEKTPQSHDSVEAKELPQKSEAQKPIKKPDPLMNEVISLGFDEETEDDTDEFIIPAGEISPSGEMETMTAIFSDITATAVAESIMNDTWSSIDDLVFEEV